MKAKFGILIAAVLAAVTSILAQPVTLLDGKLKLDTTDAFALKKAATSSKQSIADFDGGESDAWGAVTRGTHGLQPDGLDTYMKNKVAEYTKGLSWVPKLNWLKKEVVTIDGRKWADIRFIVPRKNAKDPRDGLLYTRILATSHEGQLLEIMFTSNTDEDRVLKDKIDKVIESVQLEDGSRVASNPDAPKTEPVGVPIDEKIYTFNAIEQQKFELAGKVVRIEVTPKLLQSEQIANDNYRAMLKDTGTPQASYGQVEFPGDGLIKLGFLKRTVSGGHTWKELEQMGVLGRTAGPPISFYVKVVPIGKEPAARSIAVGSKVSRGRDGNSVYTW